jgi:type III secretory pathway component EscR
MTAAAQVAGAALLLAAGDADGGSSWLSHLGVTALVALLPFVAIAGTSFAKIALVLMFVRSALGAPGVPPTTVVTALAVAVSMFVMAPVATEMSDAAREVAARSDEGDPDADAFGIERAQQLYAAASPPLLDFLERNTTKREVEYFSDMRNLPADEPPGLSVLLPAFAVSEMVEGFMIGVLIVLPFVVIDLIVGNTLIALGLQAVPAPAIALPLKLLLFVTVDGWRLVIDGLVVSYGL